METLWVTAWSLIDRWRVSGMSRVSRFILTLSIGGWGLGVGGSGEDSREVAIDGAIDGSGEDSEELTHCSSCSSWACWGLAVKATFLPEALAGVLAEVLVRVLRSGMGWGWGIKWARGRGFLGRSL